MKLDKVLDTIQETYLHMNRESIELALATALSGKVIKITPVWLFIVDVPSSGKTVVTKWLEKMYFPNGEPDVNDPDDKGKELTYKFEDFTVASVQDWVGHASRKCVVVHDMVKLLEKDPETFATLRLLYEQTFTRRTGRGDRDADLEFGFSMVANATHFIDGFFEVEAKLGGVFLKYRPDKLTRKQRMDFKSPVPKDNERIIRMLQDFVNGLDYEDLFKVKNPHMDELKELADAVEQMRSVLWKEDEILMVVPESSYPYRLTLQADFLAKALAWLRGKKKVTLEEIKTAGKTMVGTIPNVRYSIINSINKDGGIWVIIKGDKDHNLAAHGLRVGMTGLDLAYRLRELEQLHILIKSKPSKTATGYQLAPEITEALELFSKVVPISESDSREWSPIDEEDYDAMIEQWRKTVPEDTDDELDDQQKEAMGD